MILPRAKMPLEIL